MRKIQFNEETIQEIRNFVAEGHNMKEIGNRFNLKEDTLRRVMFENDIKLVNAPNVKRIEITPGIENQVCNLFNDTKMRVQDICAEVKIPNYMLQVILKRNFTKEQIDKRNAVFYRESKLGNKNPMKDLSGEKHPEYKGLVDTGDGYLMCLKPDWYTGRKSQTYVYVHHIEFCLSTGITEIPKGFVVHHIDLNKKNNDISNLALMTISAHGRLHAMLNRMSKVQRLSENGVGETRNAEQ